MGLRNVALAPIGNGSPSKVHQSTFKARKRSKLMPKMGMQTETMDSANADIDITAVDTTMAGFTTEMTNMGLDLSAIRD